MGIVVPGLPTTVFFIIAAAAFARSNPRLEQWVLGLPGIGPAVRQYRAGLGMPRAAKIAALASIVIFSGLALFFLRGTQWGQVAVGLAGLAGVGFICLKVPTRGR